MTQAFSPTMNTKAAKMLLADLWLRMAIHINTVRAGSGAGRAGEKKKARTGKCFQAGPHSTHPFSVICCNP